MDIDFHHAATYVVSRCGGLGHAEAEIVAYCAQYVDDATNEGLIRFDNGASYSRIATAHKMLDYRNTQELANHRVWVPFHFLPGNGGLPAGQSPAGTFVQKLICLPNSPVAKEMVALALRQKQAPFGLHRLGVTAHVFMDTWAHQGFVGVVHEVNEASGILGPDGRPDTRLMDRLANYFLSQGFPLGHGAVLGNPDRPYLVWSYTNGLGQSVKRDNPTEFMAAADAFCNVVRSWVSASDRAVSGLQSEDRQAIMSLIQNTRDPAGADRHRVWLEAIAAGHFRFGPERLNYISKGEGSWKHVALGTTRSRDEGDEVFPFRPSFLTSHWKYFHDAVLSHRHEIITEVLPRYGILTA